MADLRQRLEHLLEGGGPAAPELRRDSVTVYGAGKAGRKAAGLLGKAGVKVSAFLDARADGLSKVDGVPAYNPMSDEAKALARQGLPVLLGIFNHATDLRPVRKVLREVGFGRIVNYAEFHEQFGSEDEFWLTKRSYYGDKIADVMAGFDLFADRLSQEIFCDSIAYRLGLGDDKLQEPDTENQYLPADLPRPSAPMRLVDGGAFNGDTLQSFLRHDIRFEAVAAFEPDAANYHLLEAEVSKNQDLLGNVTLFRCGIGEKGETLNFREGGGAGSALVATGGNTIDVVALDEAIPEFEPTFIKLDIEGAEPAALRGAKGLIRRSQPRLAVCAYHAPDHLWSIPRLIHELEPRYRLALRYHQWNGFDAVVYAYR